MGSPASFSRSRLWIERTLVSDFRRMFARFVAPGAVACGLAHPLKTGTETYVHHR
jgi:hypothetical protein